MSADHFRTTRDRASAMRSATAKVTFFIYMANIHNNFYHKPLVRIGRPHHGSALLAYATLFALKNPNRNAQI